MALRQRIRSLMWTVLLAGCAPATPPERVEWLTMGTVAAVQYEEGGMRGDHPQDVVKRVFADVERLLNAHDPASELSRLAPLPDDEVVRRCDDAVRSCYEAAFRLMAETDGALPTSACTALTSAPPGDTSACTGEVWVLITSR